MTTKTISTYIASGYALMSKYSNLVITATGGVGGVGVSSATLATITNYGRINAASANYGVNLLAGGAVTNAAHGTISGGEGIVSSAPARVVNDGSIVSVATGGPSYAVHLKDGGQIYNDGLMSGEVFITGQSAVVENYSTITVSVDLGAGGRVSNGYNDGTYGGGSGLIGNGVYARNSAATVTNYGTIAVRGVQLYAGGRVVNGAASDTTAHINSVNYGVHISGSAIVSNFATIVGQLIGVDLTNGGAVTNGAVTDQAALIKGNGGIAIGGSAVTLTNFGTVQSVGGAALAGVYSSAGGKLINGSVSDRAALISGGLGVEFGAVGTVSNYGTLNGQGPGMYNSGLDLIGGGVVSNGAASDQAALIEGYSGVDALSATATVTNLGTIAGLGGVGHGGVYLKAGGSVIDGSATDHTALIEGYTGVSAISAAATVTNFGTIAGQGAGNQFAVYLKSGGRVINGSAGDTTALISGSNGVDLAAVGGVTNYGVIDGFNNDGVVLSVSGNVANAGTIESGVAGILLATGVITNGHSGNRTALIAGYAGIGIDASGSATLINYGAVTSARSVGALIVGGGSIANLGQIAGGVEGVGMGGTGAVTNGSAGYIGALIKGASGIDMDKAGTVANFGLIVGVGAAATNYGVVLRDGGVVINGSKTDVGASVAGYTGISALSASATVTNFGTISGQGSGSGEGGLDLAAGGLVTNGGGGDRSALIQGGGFGLSAGAYASVANAGIIEAAGTGLALNNGGNLVNGSVNNHAASIEGETGVYLKSSGFVSNFGTIAGLGDSGGAGVYLHGGAGAFVGNGSSGHTGALIEGYQGVVAYGLATVTNFGTIEGGSGVALRFESSSDVLNVAAGSTFEGVAIGGGGTLVLTSGTGTISNFASGNLTVSGSMAPATFEVFNTVQVSAGAAFIDAGAVTIGAGQTVIAAGALSIGSVANSGTLSVSGTGTLTVNGAVSGKGSASINGGLLDLTAGFTENVTFAGTTGVLELAQSQTYSGSVSGFVRSGKTSFDLNDIAFVSAGEATFSGTSTGGVLSVTDGTHTAHINLKGNYLSSTFTASSDGHGGTTVVDPKAQAPVAIMTPAPSANTLIGAMASLGAGASAVSLIRSEAWHAAAPTLMRPGTVLA